MDYTRRNKKRRLAILNAKNADQRKKEYKEVICQTTWRVIHGESVPADEKLASPFEPHTDIIRKDRRDTYYGHKICLVDGAPI